MPCVCDFLYSASAMERKLGGNKEQHLVGAKPGMYRLPPQAAGSSTATFEGTIAEFASSVGDTVGAQMWNRSKKCPACAKVNAVTMTACNGCGQSLIEEPEGKTENVPMGFVYGVAKAERFPLKLSIRLEEPTMLVYDDPLARSTCHLNAIPTDVNLPDWRWLLVHPAKGLELMRRLDDAAWRAVEGSFCSYSPWRETVIKPGALGSSSDLRPHCIAALNAVVSQYQLHMHYIVPPFRPDSFHSLLNGARFERGRWLPLEYVLAALEALLSHPEGGIADAPAKETAELLALIEARGGPVYQEVYEAATARYIASHEVLANWSAEAFEGVAMAQGAELSFVPNAAGGEPRDAKALLKEDAKLLSSYGWSAEDGVPAPRSYYSFAKAPNQVLTASAWSSAP
jgi:hypothetical protein